jgi:hypothetical protein
MSSVSVPLTVNTVRFGVGIDTARYGHCAAFLRSDLQPAAPDLTFAESGAGYTQLRDQLAKLAKCHSHVTFNIRLDAAGQYADNLFHFLSNLSSHPDLANATIRLSCGDPQRNKNYRSAIFGHKKSDPIEAQAAARFALTENPKSDNGVSLSMRTLRQTAGRLLATTRQRTRVINQLHATS